MLLSSVSVNPVKAVVDLEVRLRLSFFRPYACWREQKPFLFFLVLPPRSHHGSAPRRSGAQHWCERPSPPGGEQEVFVGHLGGALGRPGKQMTSQPASGLNPVQALSVSELPMLGTAAALRQGVSAEGVWGRRVLVTGAGGSIGSELVKQISRLAPKRLCLVDSCEFNLYQVSYALERERPVKNWSACICDIRDEIAMRHLFLRESPEIVFHAAALKHVPLLEEHNVVEAVLTNVLGTKIVMDLCASTGADFIAISTDKAVNPSSQMGLTKRVAEIYIHDRALRHPDARVSLVRFGNVVGSSGSVVPLFRKQIEAGGPVTVTHPDMTRYLMSIEDAVRLTLAAASLPQEGFALYVLEMGKAVRIFDLAVEMIRLAGKQPFVDIDVTFVGVRPGEKLHEELSYAWEHLSPTAVAGVQSATPDFDPRPKLRKIDELIAAAQVRDCDWIKRVLPQIVPEYAPGGDSQAVASQAKDRAINRTQSYGERNRRPKGHTQPAVALP
jgi:O-antigen biosynthesis protein WbqV